MIPVVSRDICRMGRALANPITSRMDRPTTGFASLYPSYDPAAPARSGNALRGTEWGSRVESETPITVQATMKRPRSLCKMRFHPPGLERRSPIPPSNGAIVPYGGGILLCTGLNLEKCDSSPGSGHLGSQHRQ